MNLVWLTLGLFFVFALLGIPIAMSIGMASAAALLSMGTSLVVVAQKMFIAANSFTLIAIPFFMLVGAIMERSGITERLVNFAKALIGWLRHGMTYVTIVAGILMGGISGSATADTAALSGMLIPAMEKQGYPRKFTAPLQAAAGTLGVIIPPSLCMIVLGSVTNLQVSKLFIAGIVPGCLVGLCLAVVSYVICQKNGFGEEDTYKFSFKELGRAAKEAVWALLVPVIIVGGILLGVFTPTEASVVAVFYTLAVGMFVNKTIRIRDLPAIFCDAARSTGTVMFVIGTSSVWSWILSYANVPGMLVEAITSVTQNPVAIMLIITVIFLVGGMFIDGTPLIIMLVPLFYPVASAVGFDPLAFGIIICICNAMGAITPPVGAALFVACASGSVKLESTFRYVMPIVAAELVSILILCLFPQTASFLPALLG